MNTNTSPIEFGRIPTNCALPMIGTPSPVVDLAGIYRGSAIVGQLGRCATGEYVTTVGRQTQVRVHASRADVRDFLAAL